MKTSSIDDPTTTSETLTIEGWVRDKRTLISRTEVRGKPSRSFSSLTFLRAHITPVSLSRALQGERREKIEDRLVRKPIKTNK